MPGGDLFKCAMHSNSAQIKSLEYYMYLHDLHKDPISRYLLGINLTTASKQEEFYKYIDDKYIENAQDYYTFRLPDNISFKLPLPTLNDRKVYRMELTDLILPYLLGYSNNINLPFNEGPYEYGKVKLRKNDVVLDLGANFGMFSAFASSKGCNVYAFEPTVKTVDNYLSKTSELNSNISISNFAVSNYNGMQEFTIDEKDCRCNGISETKTNILQHKENKILVPTITIDTFVSQNNLAKVDFIKSDIEGAERLMLKGAKETLKEHAPDLAICYYHLIDDYKVLTDLILEANSDYVIEHRWKKIYAYSKKKHR